MSPQFKSLFTVNLNHDYFQNGKLQGFSIKPNAKTDIIIKQIGGRIRQTEAGFSVYYDPSNSELLTEELLADWELYLQITDPKFWQLTNLPIEFSHFLFTNSQDKTLILTKGETHSDSKPYGITLKLSIPLHSEETYTLDFSARKSTWCYFLINRNGLNGTFGIKSEGVSFSDLGTTEIPGGTQAQLFQSNSPIAFSQVSKIKADL